MEKEMAGADMRSLRSLLKKSILEIIFKIDRFLAKYSEAKDEFSEIDFEKFAVLMKTVRFTVSDEIGWLDDNHNLWFLGRKIHRVETIETTYYSIQMEAIFNQL